MLFKFIEKIFINILIYLSLLAVLTVNQGLFGQAGIIGQKFNLSHYTMTKSQYLIDHLEHQNLAVNFLVNQRTLSDEEKIEFQSSGLIHLLAVSGAQIIPICNLFSFILMQIFYFLLRNTCHSSSLLKILFYFKSLTVISISFLMAGLFSCTGALLRVAFLSSINDFLKSQKYISFVSIALPIFSDCTIRKFILFVLASALFGNIFADYSFLLSSIGALVLEIISINLNFFFKKIHYRYWIKFLFKGMLLSLCTSFLISILLYPVVRVSFVLSSFSNILAAPIVTFLITPISLILLFIPQDTCLQPYILFVFDHSLGLLAFIANVFQDTQYELSLPKILLFSYEGKVYLILLLIILSALSDTIRARDEVYLQNFFKINSQR